MKDLVQACTDRTEPGASETWRRREIQSFRFPFIFNKMFFLGKSRQAFPDGRVDRMNEIRGEMKGIVKISGRFRRVKI